MRLINTRTLKFEEFFDDRIPKYSILSHRWSENQEVSYEQYLAGQRKKGYGYRKITKLCEISLANGYKWTWVDTCCIDKRSSAELSEAMNSMFRWYKKAQVCYTFLPDVHRMPGDANGTGSDLAKPDASNNKEFQQSTWFKRGWTLQELLAPEYVLFFDSAFRIIGNRESLAEQISHVTGIDRVALSRTHASPSRFNFAAKMAWAVDRKTSREEDMAYCLMGLLEVNMPLLYGEGRKKAFMRLQKEYLTQSNDDSIFAWLPTEEHSGLPDLLASSPAWFRGCGPLRQGLYRSCFTCSVTNLGVELELPIPSFVSHRTGSCQILYQLCCQIDWDGPDLLLSVIVHPGSFIVWEGSACNWNGRLWTGSRYNGGSSTSCGLDSVHSRHSVAGTWMDALPPSIQLTMRGTWIKSASAEDKVNACPNLEKHNPRSNRRQGTSDRWREILKEAAKWDESVVFRRVAFQQGGL